jgi:hypothetical protein
MREPLQAYTLNEARCYLHVTACEACGAGPWELDPPRTDPAGLTTIAATCHACSRRATFAFRIAHDVPPTGPEAETLNPTDQPSRIIDPGQWLGLFYLRLEMASGGTSKAESRREGFRASLCLGEALKFYEDDELPPEAAFFAEASRAAFREHPSKFARQRLRDMRAKLPTLEVMAANLARDERRQRRKWWQVWR